MGIVAFLISTSLLIVNLISNKNKKSISPIVLFFALWTLILFLSILNLYDIYKPTNEAYLLIILMLLFFELGIIINMLVNRTNIVFPFIKNYKENRNETREYKIRFKLFYILSSLIIIFYIIDCIIILIQLAKGIPMWQIRNWTLEPYGSSNPILDRRSFVEESLRTIVLTPFALIIPAITSFYFFKSKNNKQRYGMLITSIAVLMLSSFAGGGGRLGFLYYIGCFIMAFFIVNKKSLKDAINKHKKVIILAITLGIMFVFINTIIRTGIGNFTKQIYTYFALPPTLLSLWIPTLKCTKYTYGMTTFFGLHSYFFRTLDMIGLDFLVPQIYNDAYTNILNAEIFKNVGYGVGNAFVTPVYYFFADGGYLFVCIASLFFGYIVSNWYKKFEENINMKNFVVYSLIMYGVFVTFMRIQTAIPAYIVSFILVIFTIKSSREDVNYK